MYLRMGKATIALILIALTAFLLPVQVFAQSLSIDEIISESQIEEPYTVGNILSEIESEREEYSKHFRLDDGSYMAVNYEQPIHYKDENGEWLEYDNSLITKKDTSTANGEASSNEYTNKSSDIKVNYAKKSKESNMVKIKTKDYMVSWGYENTNNVNGTVITNEEDLEGNEKFTALKNLNSEIVYENVYDNVDIQYITNTIGIKENIILKNADAPSEFTVEYKINKLTATAIDDKLIELSDKSGNIVYLIEAPYMIDADGKTSTQLSLTIVEQKNSKLTLKLSADEEFLAESKYPVTIDPTFTTSQDWDVCDCSYVDNSHPNTAYGDQVAEVSVGYYGAGRYRTYFKMDSLPTLNKGDMVVGAYLNMHLKKNDFYQNMDIGAYYVTGTWTQTGLTWNNKPTNNSNVIDYETFVANDPNAWHDWDVTECVKRWYSGETNNGIMLKPLDESNEVQCATFYSSNTSVSTPRPLFSIIYRNNKGLENYWTYSSFQVGTAGIVYVNDYSGNMVFVETDAATPSGYSQATVQHVFNGYMAGVKYKDTMPYTGEGWRLNLQQTLYSSSKYGLTGDAKANYPYVYTDQDGTEHYFYKKGTKYLDEDGLGLELTINSGNTDNYYVISDDKNNKYRFNNDGLLTSSKDSNGNTVTVNYASDGVTIQSVTDNAGNTITLLNNADNGRLRYVKDCAGRQTQYNYESGRLIEIVRPDGNSVQFTYNDRGLIKSIIDVDGYSVVFTYTTAASGSKVETITEKGKNGTAGQVITFNRTKYNTTVINTYGADGVSGTNDDVTSTYQFDEYGRTISVKSKAKNRDLGASVYKYTSGKINEVADNIKKLNRVDTEFSTGSNAMNLIKNPNLESTSNWTTAAWGGTNNFTASAVSSTKYYGHKSLKINVTSYEGDSRGRVYQDIVLTPGGIYTLSGYIKTVGVTNGTINSGALLCAQSNNTDGSANLFYSDFVYGNTNETIDGGWQRVTCSFTVPSNSKSVRINLALRRSTGTAYFDGIQLEQYGVANDFNLLENANLEEYSSNGLPTSWSAENSNLDTSTDKKNTSYYYSGSSSFMITGSSTKNKGLSQDVNISGSENDTYIVSGWAKADAVAQDAEDTRRFRIAVKVTYNDRTVVTKPAARFNLAVSDWQYTSAAFNLSDGTSTNKTPIKITVILRYHKQCNKVYFDNISLIKDDTQSYTYDNDGNIVSVVANAKNQSTMEYSNSDLVKDTDAKGYAYNYEYDNNHNMTKATSQNGVSYTYNYNDRGLANSLEISGTNGSKIITNVNYNSNGLISRATDQDGYVTSYTYNDTTGTLASVTDNSGTTSYTYDANTDALTSANKGNSTVGYSYSDDSKYLESITHNSTNYNLVYDQYGNRTNSKVGTTSLASYTYNANNGTLLSSTYGNGNTVSWLYDAYGNMSAQDYNGVQSFRWSSDRSGNVVRERDYINNIQYDSSYDTTGRPVRVIAKDFTATYNANGLLYKVGYDYDLNNNITNLIFRTPVRGVDNKYTYGKDNLLEKFEMYSHRYVEYEYDSLNRLDKTTLSTDNNVITDYEYFSSQRGDGSTTTKLKSETIDGVKYRYEYDTIGNIKKIYKTPKGGTEENLVEYSYDSLNQLTEVSDFANMLYYQYTYDAGGNITKEVITNQTTGATTTNTYSYTDTNWKDKLTAYNGATITYDAIGNPLTYRDGITMTWKNGRELATLQDSDNTVSYTYDSNNVRVTKTVDGVKYTYAYVNGLLMYETRGESKFWYSYDANGMLYSIKYTLTDSSTLLTYYYTHNSRGDIIGIYGGDGFIRAQYEYDAWGNVLSVTDANGVAITNANHVGNLNPFRYRGYYYDSETGFYLTGTRYYDPEIGRFINADGYVSTGQGILGNNMFAYCGNNPVNRADPTGMFWKEIGDFFSNAWNGIKTWAKNIFGAGSSTTATIAEIETPVIPDPSPITVKTGTKTTQTISKHGDSSKPISVYANKDAQHPIKSSSTGININIVDFTLDLSVGLDDIGLSGSLTNGNTTNSFGVKLNLSELKIGFEGSTAIQWDNTTETAYTNASISGWAIAAAYILVTTGQYVQSPSYAY